MHQVWLTAYQLLHFVAKIQPGDSVLVHAGGSGVSFSSRESHKHQLHHQTTELDHNHDRNDET